MAQSRSMPGEGFAGRGSDPRSEGAKVMTSRSEGGCRRAVKAEQLLRGDVFGVVARVDAHLAQHTQLGRAENLVACLHFGGENALGGAEQHRQLDVAHSQPVRLADHDAVDRDRDARHRRPAQYGVENLRNRSALTVAPPATVTMVSSAPTIACQSWCASSPSFSWSRSGTPSSQRKL
jgi:hypothetical protein